MVSRLTIECCRVMHRMIAAQKSSELARTRSVTTALRTRRNSREIDGKSGATERPQIRTLSSPWKYKRYAREKSETKSELTPTVAMDTPCADP
jgi:hypothetical protein